MVRILFILAFIGLSQIGKSQIQAKQIKAKYPYDSLYIMVNEPDSNATLYRLGKWYNAYDLIDSLVDVVGGGGVADGNGIFDAANNNDTAHVDLVYVTAPAGLYFQDPADAAYWGFDPNQGLIVYTDEADDILKLDNDHATQGTWIDYNTVWKIGTTIGPSQKFQIKQGAVIPFEIENTPTVTNSLQIQADGDLLFADYPNSRDDGNPGNFLGTDASGTVQSYPVSDLGIMDNWLLAATGTGGTESITDNETVTFAGAGINVATRSTNTITITGTEVDGSVTNEAWTIDGDAGDTEVINNQTVLFDGTGIVSTTYTAASNTLTIAATEVDGSTTNEAWTIDGDIGSAPEVVTTQTIKFTGTGGIQTDWDAVNDDLIIDGSGITGTGDGNFAENNLTFDANRTHDMDIYTMELTGTVMNITLWDENGGSGNMLNLGSELGAGTGITGGISYRYENGGSPTEQFDLEANKRASDKSTFAISAEENSDAEIIFEKDAGFSNNTTESHLAINGGIAHTQSYEWTASGSDLTLDRSYYNVYTTGAGGIGDEINLPNVLSQPASDNWDSSLGDADVQVGQEYVISNYRAATNLVVRTNTGDFINNGSTTITLLPNESVIIKCVRFNTVGYWQSYD